MFFKVATSKNVKNRVVPYLYYMQLFVFLAMVRKSEAYTHLEDGADGKRYSSENALWAQ